MPYGKEWVEKNVRDERIVLNMINSLLGRMHLASHVELLSEKQRNIIAEGIDYYNLIKDAKKTALPCFPNGFCRFGDKSVVSGFETDSKIYLAVWALKTDTVKVNVITEPENISIAYPKNSNVEIDCTVNGFEVSFSSSSQAVFLEVKK